MLSIDSHHKPLYVYSDFIAQRQPIPHKRLLKRGFDVCFALLIIIIILSWLIPLIGLLIRIESPGPILYIQKRTGYRGRWFFCLKFRTMTHNPKARFQQATKNDKRITDLGHFLRKTSLDEMPQFLNVLIGDMSIVGPRPHALQHSAQFWNTMPEYRKRYRVKPGITGLAQIRGCRGETDQLIKMQHRIKYDRFYNRHRSFRMDIWICWLTVKAMLNGDGEA